jgi:lipopolysaccharide biosynthesis protein
MNTTQAIIAHFDPAGSKSENWTRILKSIRSLVDRAVVVSTGITDHDRSTTQDLGFGLIERANTGYDFMSYAVGFDAVAGGIPPAQILFCNDSIYVSSEDLFTSTIQALLEMQCAAAFLTTSEQMEFHGQSYCFKIQRSAFGREQFRHFFSSVMPKASRMDVILDYEFGLSRCLKEIGAPISGLIRLPAPASRDFDRQINPTHVHADTIEAKHGYIKYERILENPLDLPKTPRIERLGNLAKEEAGKARLELSQSAPAVAICHCHYVAVADELIFALERLPDESAVIVTTSTPQVIQAFKTKWRRRRIKLDVMPVANRGRDVLPFLLAFQSLDIGPNTPLLKIHGKQSTYTALGNRWRRDLIASLLPSETAVDQIIAEFKRNPKLGLIGPNGSYIADPTYWGANRERVASLVQKITGHELEDNDFGFFAGTMFWIRAACMIEIVKVVDLNQFEAEKNQRDGTYAHVLERAVPIIARLNGWTLREMGSDDIMMPTAVRQRRLNYFA